MAVAPACKVIKCDTSARCLGDEQTKREQQCSSTCQPELRQFTPKKKKEKKRQVNRRLKLQVHSVVLSVLREKIPP